jgi:hypothetical protein
MGSEDGQSVTEAARPLSLIEQLVSNWIMGMSPGNSGGCQFWASADTLLRDFGSAGGGSEFGLRLDRAICQVLATSGTGI